MYWISYLANVASIFEQNFKYTTISHIFVIDMNRSKLRLEMIYKTYSSQKV